MKPVLCPVCNGQGTVPSRLPVTTEVTCHGCGGRGWVEVSGEDDPLKLELDFRTTTIDLTKCPACGQDRNEPALTGCPKGSHYGNY